ncbi:hypothetical protein FGB62_9g13 [Gracilaria domingensis]|nr:hypothetical protein FGB62_9g13 [Gracilaria domingensis]
MDALASWKESEECTMSFEERVAKLALKSWCLKPKKKTEDMKAGSRNKTMLQRALPEFLLSNANLVTLSARTYGLLQREGQAFSHIATSPNLIVVVMNRSLETNADATNENPRSSCSAVAVVCEFKTFSGSDSLSAAYDVRDKHRVYTELELAVKADQGDYESELHLGKLISQFHSVVPWKPYRYQIIHHTAVCQCPVLFVAASRYEIIYAVRVQVQQSIAISIAIITRHLKETQIPWATVPVGEIPKYNEHIFGFGKDHFAVTSYLKLASSFHETVSAKGPLPAAKYIRPKLVSHWNIHKGGTDVLPRVVSNCSFRMSKLSPRGTIIWRSVQIMFVNAYYTFRALRTDENAFTSYRRWRKAEANVLTFRRAVKDMFLSFLSPSDIQTPTLSSRVRICGAIVGSLSKSGIRFRSHSRGALSLDKTRFARTGKHIPILHSRGRIAKENQVVGNPGWFIICSKTDNSQGKPRRVGMKSRYACEECKVFLCRVVRREVSNRIPRSCGDQWHTLKHI